MRWQSEAFLDHNQVYVLRKKCVRNKRDGKMYWVPGFSMRKKNYASIEEATLFYNKENVNNMFYTKDEEYFRLDEKPDYKLCGWELCAVDLSYDENKLAKFGEVHCVEDCEDTYDRASKAVHRLRKQGIHC